MRKLILAAAAVGTLVAPTVAMASTGYSAPAKGTAVHVCVSHTKHGLEARLAKTCRRGEKGITVRLAVPRPTVVISKTVTGPQGPAGLQGPQGNPGANGANGATGAFPFPGCVGPNQDLPPVPESKQYG